MKPEQAYLTPVFWFECGRRTCESAKVCDDGFHCVSGANTPRPYDSIYTSGNLCERGDFCLNGLKSDCPADQDNQGQSVCKTCPAGYRCDRNQINPENCEPGEFCPESTEVPTKCQIGTFNEAQNSFDETFCVTCLPGT